MTEKKIGLKLREKRKSLGLTLEQVAKYVGVNESTVSRWELGEIDNMRRDRIASLSAVLKISPLFILGMEEPEDKKRLVTNTPEETKLITGYRGINAEAQKMVLGMIDQLRNIAAAL